MPTRGCDMEGAGLGTPVPYRVRGRASPGQGTQETQGRCPSPPQAVPGKAHPPAYPSLAPWPEAAGEEGQAGMRSSPSLAQPVEAGAGRQPRKEPQVQAECRSWVWSGHGGQKGQISETGWQPGAPLACGGPSTFHPSGPTSVIPHPTGLLSQSED